MEGISIAVEQLHFAHAHEARWTLNFEQRRYVVARRAFD